MTQNIKTVKNEKKKEKTTQQKKMEKKLNYITIHIS